MHQIRAQLGADKRIAFVSGNFNIIHPGHLRLLKFAAESADFLVVGVLPDQGPGITIPVDMRLEGVKAISWVDRAVLLGESAEDFIAKLQPDIVIKGKEYETLKNPEQAVVESYGGKLVFGSGEVRFSSLSLMQREYFEVNLSSIRKPTDYPMRHGFDMTQLVAAVRKVIGLRVLVIGDLIVDEYVNCEPLGMSQEDPTLVLTPIDSKRFVGGAGIVAAHARGLGAKVEFLTVAGADEAADYARESLAKYGVHFDILTDETRPTTRKQRFRAHNKTLLRVNHLRQHAISAAMVEQIVAAAEDRLADTDLILFSDFNYGCVPQPLVNAISGMAALRNIMMAADSQASSQYSDVSRFRGVSLITPTEREARLALRDFESGLVTIGQQLREVTKVENVVITLGSEGLLLLGEKDGDLHTDRLPAFNIAPKDPAGAGDSFFTCASLALCAGVSIWDSAYLGSLAAACQVSRVGNIPLTTDDLINEIEYGN